MIDSVTSYYERERTSRERHSGPDIIPMQMAHWQHQWKERWLDEFFSDLFACYILGPAYVWAHLHVTTKTSHNVFHLDKPPIPQSHPSDEARMRMLAIGLESIGFQSDLKRIRDVWNQMPFISSSAPIHEYQFAFPKSLMEKIAELLLDGMNESGFSIMTPELLKELDDSAIRKILNNSWLEFWKNPNYVNWEKKLLNELKQNI